VISHHVEEGFLTHKIARTVDGVAVSTRRVLLGNESHRSRQTAGRLRVTSLIARPDHHADFTDVGGECLFNQDAENGFLRTVVDESLQRQRPLIPTCRCDNRLPNPHVGGSSGELGTKRL
jgi:hypothetical protein